jgi:hypothetical protein
MRYRRIKDVLCKQIDLEENTDRARGLRILQLLIFTT